MSTPRSNPSTIRETMVPEEASGSMSTDSRSPIQMNSGPIRTWPRVHPSRGQIRSCIEFSPGTGDGSAPQPSSRNPHDGSQIRTNVCPDVPIRDIQNAGRTSRSSSIHEISGAHSLSSGGAGCVAGSSRRTSLSHLNSSSRNSMTNPTFLDINHLIGLNHVHFGAVDEDFGDDDNSISQSHSASSSASGMSGMMEHDSLEDLHRQQDAEFQDILADFADQQHELEQRMPRTSHSQNSLSLSSVVSNEDTSESCSVGTLSEIFESLSRFSEHCLASVEALNSPIYLNTSSFTTTPTGPSDNFEFQFDYEAPHSSNRQMEGGGSSDARVGMPGGVTADGYIGRDSGRGPGKSGLLGINEAHHRRAEFFRGMLERQPPNRHDIYGDTPSDTGGQSASATNTGDLRLPGNQIRNEIPKESGGAVAGSSSSSDSRRTTGNILLDIGLELEIFSAGLEFGNIIDLPAVPSTSRAGDSIGVVGEASGENSIVAALNVLRDSEGPLVSSLDWQGRCMELELALQRFGEQATRARIMLRDKHLKLNLQLAEYVGCLPFKWDPRTQRAVYENSKIRHLICKFQVASHLIYAILQVLSMINCPYDTTSKSIGLVFCAVYSTALGLRYNWDLDRVPMELNNSLIDFEEKFFRELNYEKTLLNTLISGLIPLVLWTGIFCPVAFVLVLAKFPCAPPFLGSMLQSCKNGLEPSISTRMLILVFEFLMFLPAVIASAFNVCFIFFPGIFCMWDYLRIVGKWNIKPKYGDITTKRMQFYTASFRKLQILGILYALSSSKRLIPTCVIGFPAIQFVTCYVCIRFHDQIPWPEFAMFPLVYFDGFFINIVMFTAASRIYEHSCELLRKWRQTKQNLQLRKNLCALAPLKVKLGDNFVDGCTPLVIQDFCIQNTASGLLISK